MAGHCLMFWNVLREQGLVQGPGGVPTWLMEQLWEKPGVVRRTTSPADA